MEYMAETLTVLAILVAVAVAAVAFEPANPVEHWTRLAEHYATDGRPDSIQYSAQQILFGGPRGSLKPLGPDASFDVAIDDFGLWLAGRGIDADGTPRTLRIPGTHVRPAGRRGMAQLFKLYAEPPVRIAVVGELGAELLKKSQPA
jgi:hypothetical protein